MSLIKNLWCYRLTAPFTHTADDLEAALAAHTARLCGPQELVTLGWSPALGGATTALVHSANGGLLLCLRRHTRSLPAAAVKAATDQHVRQIAAAEQRPVGAREYRALRDDIAARLLPGTPVTPHDTRIIIDPIDGWLMVDARSARLADVAASCLRQTLGTLPAKPLTARNPPRALMTWWLSGLESCADFSLADACELRDAEDSRSVIRCQGQDLASEEMRHHLLAGKSVTKLSLVWDKGLRFTLTDALALTRLKMDGEILDVAFAQAGADDEPLDDDIELALWVAMLRQLLDRLDTLFGLTEQEAAI